jgi:hypothetical protein
MPPPQLELDAKEAVTLKETLESAVSELGYEIANTDAKDFRDQLKQKRDVLQRLVGQLSAS